MTRYLVRLAIIGLLIILTPAVILLLGYSFQAATLGAVLVAALCWAPTLLALEGMSRVRRLERHRG